MANPKTAKKHALQRLKSRQGIKDRNVVDDIVKEVLANGVRVKDVPEGDVREALFRRCKSNTQKKYTYYYNGFVYVFNTKYILVTTYELDIRRKR